ncbi:MAG: sugar phosphate isomerase/epimerase [Gemmatimonadetes bacterium]|jgi:sugar phosphate isomerase/epimerase|nr:sugar phosphate isomerase/epimerase [Gemmatimonadota bacterium]MBT6149911.1 sugar phosphate isomerase/epimerase [Gemmatimonadota bacterium]MBT7860235.1 sugar phosphate isomerase/epimerase [Gemmatimonadota bacterium]
MFRLGVVTYQIAKDWDIDTLIANCSEVGFEGAELRTTHAHGVEVDLDAAARTEVKAKFADSAVELVGLGSAFDYDAIDPQEVKSNIEGTKEVVKLAADVGAAGVKVRPNKIHEDEGVPREQTFEQIGLALRECGAFAREHGVEIRLEVHGRITCEPPNIRSILDYADSDNVFACWNSNMQDRDEAGCIDDNFALLAKDIRLVHITELSNEYPWARLFELLGTSGYDGFTLAEIPAAEHDALRLMRYYRALWLAYGGGA